MRENTADRRRFLTLASAFAAMGVAGCTGGNGNGNGNGNGADSEDHDDDDHEDDDHDDEQENGDHEHDTEHVIGHPEEHVTVDMMSMEGAEHFIPHVVHIEVGGTVTWEMADDLEAHDSTSYHPLYNKPLRLTDEDEHWQSPEMEEQGATWDRTFEVEGVYDYFCGPHWEDDMMGRVIVGWPHNDPDEHPALGPPQDELADNEKEMIEMFNEMTQPVFEEDDH